MQGTLAQADDGDGSGGELSTEERDIVARYPPALKLEPELRAIRAAAERLKTKPEEQYVQAAYRESIEFGEYWAEVYEDLRLHGMKALERYYNAADLWECDGTLGALDAVLWALRSDILRAGRDQRALELKFGLCDRQSEPRTGWVTQ